MPRAEQMPVSLGKLARRQGFELSSIRFQSDVDRLLPNLEKALAVEQARREAAKKSDPATKTSAPRARKVRETSGAGRSPTNLSTTLPTILRTEARGLLGADLGDVQDVVKWIDQTTWPDDPRECANIIRGKMFVDPDIASHGPLYMAMLNALRNVSESST